MLHIHFCFSHGLSSCIHPAFVFLLESSYLQVSTTVTVDEALTGLKTSFSFKVPDHKSGKVSMFRSKRGNISFPETQKMSSAMCAGSLIHCIWPTCCVYWLHQWLMIYISTHYVSKKFFFKKKTLLVLTFFSDSLICSTHTIVLRWIQPLVWHQHLWLSLLQLLAQVNLALVLRLDLTVLQLPLPSTTRGLDTTNQISRLLYYCKLSASLCFLFRHI